MPPRAVAASEREPHAPRPGDHTDNGHDGVPRLGQARLARVEHRRGDRSCTPHHELDAATQAGEPEQQRPNPYHQITEVVTDTVEMMQPGHRGGHQGASGDHRGHLPSHTGLITARRYWRCLAQGFADSSQIAAVGHRHRTRRTPCSVACR
ncbi:Uncharacterised protein [Mycobacteroides abscessus subsp. abscessus]|nr:Uncharacterised protein [Mycobacteroides abscessus subsp. abscessus]